MKNLLMMTAIPRCLSEKLDLNPVTLADVGASGGIHKRWLNLGSYLRVLGFEPDKTAFDSLPRDSRNIWINAALADREKEAKLFITRHQTNTSLLTPNRPVVDRIYKNISDFDIIEEVVVPCTTLDLVSSARDITITALKADTQGTELAILHGADKSINNNILALELEVEFTDIYSNQPLFRDIDIFMKDKGFMLFDLGNQLYHKWRHSYSLGGRKGQLLAADVLYFRGPESILQMASTTRELELILAHFWAVCWVYGYVDLAFETALAQIDSGRLSEVTTKCILSWASKAKKGASGTKTRGRGRLASWLRYLANHIEPTDHAFWCNPLGNR